MIEFLSGDTQPIQRELERTDARGGRSGRRSRKRRASATGSTRSATSPSGRPQTAGTLGTVDVIGLAGRGDIAAVQVFPLRDGRMVDRHGFTLENVAGQDTARSSRRSARVLRQRAERAAARRRPARGRATSPRSRSSCPRGAARGSRCAPAQRGEKRRLQELAQRERRARARQRGARRRAPARIRRIEALEELREALNLESLPSASSASTSRTSRTSRRSGRWSSSRTRRRRRPTTASSASAHGRPGRLRDDRRGRAGGSRACAGDGRRVRRGFRAACPNLVVVDGGKGQLSAALEAMHAYDLARVAVVALAKRERRSSCPGSRAGRARSRLGRAPAPAADPGRGAPVRARLPPHAAGRAGEGVDPRRAPRSRAGAQARADRRHFSSPERLLAATRDELEGVPGRPGEDRQADLRRPAQDRAAHDSRSRPSAPCCARRGSPTSMRCAVLVTPRVPGYPSARNG